jgi:hypothetical protein
MNKITRSIVVALAAAGLALAAASTASADTNKSDQKSTISGPIANLMSPNVGPRDSRQANGQTMTKTNTSNFSIIDYFGFDDEVDL